MSWSGCLCVLLPLPVCQLALCGAGLWSQICLLHLADVHGDFMVDRKGGERNWNRRESVTVCMCANVCDACAAKLTGAGCPGCVHA